MPTRQSQRLLSSTTTCTTSEPTDAGVRCDCENVTCVICTDALEGGAGEQSVHALECGHRFHSSCILTWFRNGNKTCPLCRDEPAAMSLLDTRARARRLLAASKKKRCSFGLKKASAKGHTCKKLHGTTEGRAQRIP